MSNFAKAIVLGVACTIVAFLGTGSQFVEAQAQRPNIVFILTDDLDAASIERMPLLDSLLRDRGTTFKNAFVTNSLCCPSRATILRGQYSHNHRVLTNKPPLGGFEKFRGSGLDRSTVATWLRSDGYRTAYIGKYFNGYEGSRYVPPGWSRWYGSAGGGYYGFRINENGRFVSYKGDNNYLTDVFARKATAVVEQSANKSSPFFMYLAPKAPHEPALPAKRHRRAFSNAKLPSPPSFNERDVSDKPAWVRNRARLSDAQIREARILYRNRLRSLLAVDEMIGRVIGALRKSGELDNTYVLFTSDNGFHMGHHRLPPGKWTAYEEDIRVPLIVRGPGVPMGRVRHHLVLNNDLAPTMAQLGRARAPGFVDGRSLKPLLTGQPPPETDWRSAFLAQARRGQLPRPGYETVRTERHLYTKYETGERELYDLREDPYQMRSLHETADAELVAHLQERLAALRDCTGEECRTAED